MPIRRKCASGVFGGAGYEHVRDCGTHDGGRFGAHSESLFGQIVIRVDGPVCLGARLSVPSQAAEILKNCGKFCMESYYKCLFIDRGPWSVLPGAINTRSHSSPLR